MEELIIKYITGQLSASEMDSFRSALTHDDDLLKEYKLYLATLALTDYSLDYPKEEIRSFSYQEIENSKQE